MARAADPIAAAMRVARDTGKNRPESAATLAEQMRALKAGERKAVMFPKGTAAPSAPAGLGRVETPRGVFIFDPRQISAEQIRALSAAGRENEILGLGPHNKDDVARTLRQGEMPKGVVERTPAGVESRSAAASDQTLRNTLAAMQAGKSSRNSVGVEALGQVLAGRRK